MFLKKIKLVYLANETKTKIEISYHEVFGIFDNVLVGIFEMTKMAKFGTKWLKFVLNT